MEYFGFGEYEFGSNAIIEGMKRGISGTHRLNGMMLLWGKAASTSVHLRDTQIVDLAPTILHMMGEPVPQDMDGRVLTDALGDEYAQGGRLTDPPSTEGSFPVPTAADDAAGAVGIQPLTDEDKELMADRLRGLGYVG
jgi:hypothetical protein